MTISNSQVKALQGRFLHFNPDKCGSLFHTDQPEDGTFSVDGKKHPAALMRNGAKWFYDREHRPTNKQGQPLKTKAPAGTRRMLFDTLEPAELLVVEGEGHAIACCSLGLKGVVAAGGVNTLLTNKPQAREHRRQVFQGKSVRLLFDPDEAGQAAVTKAARGILEAGAARTTTILLEALPESWLRGMDVEDWLASFDTPEAATVGLMELLGATSWADPEEDDSKQKPLAVESERFPLVGTGRSALVTTVYDTKSDKLQLAIFAPENLLDDRPQEVRGYGDHHDAQPSAEWAVRVVDSWTLGGRIYEPPPGSEFLAEIRERAVMAPAAPFEGPDADEELWRDLLKFLERWVVLAEPVHYMLVAAWAMLSYRLNDAMHRYVPPLRFTGLPGTGKSIALTCVHALAYWARMYRWTPDNVHRVADAHRDGVLLFDELHLDRGRAQDGQERMIDQCANSFDRHNREGRYEGAGKGMRTYRTFLMYATGGYAADEHQGIARRSVVIPMGRVKLALHQQYLDMPEGFYAEAEELRGRLLAWRFRRAPEPKQDEEGNPLADRLKQVAGKEIGQAFWPLLQVVPPGCTADLEALFDYIKRRREAVRGAIQHEEVAELLGIVATMAREGRDVLRTPSGVQVPAKYLVPSGQQMLPRISVRQINKQLVGAGLKKKQIRVRKEQRAEAAGIQLPGRFDGYDLDLRQGSKDRRAFEAYGVELPGPDEAGEYAEACDEAAPL